MNVVFLSPHFPPQYHRFCQALKNAGAKALGIGDEPWEHLTAVVRESLTEYYRVPDLHDAEALLRACGYFVHRYGRIDRLDSLNEYWLAAEARLRDDFNITGVRSAQIDTIRRKSHMKTVFRQAGIAVARGRVVRSIAEGMALAAETGFPLVAKPDAGVGAIGTFKLDNADALARFFRHQPNTDIILEEFIQGDIYSFDGLTDRDGGLVFFTAHVFSQGIMETVNDGRHLSYHSLREIPPALEEAGRKCLAAFAVRERFFHFEFFRTTRGVFVALEVNMRPPGGFTTDMFNFACDIDIYRVWAELLVHNRHELAYQRRYHCCYASRKHQRRYRHSHEAVMARHGSSILMAESVPGVFSSALGDIGYVFRHPDLDRVLEVVSYIQEEG